VHGKTQFKYITEVGDVME